MAGQGGYRPGAGRKPGSANMKTREIADRAAEEGITPLEYLLSVMRDEEAPRSERMAAARVAAPYVHPRLSAVSGEPEGNKVFVLADHPMSEEDWIKKYVKTDLRTSTNDGDKKSNNVRFEP